MKFADIDFNIGSENPSGISDIGYYVPKRDIASWPTIEKADSEEATADQVASYTGDFALKEGKFFHRIYSTQGKGSVTSEPTGETDCMMFNNVLTLSYPKNNNEGLAFSKAAVNGDFVFIVKHDGRFIVIGSPDYRTTVSPAPTTGDSAGSAKGITITATCSDVTPLPGYTGVITLEDGSLDCSTGEFTETPAA